MNLHFTKNPSSTSNWLSYPNLLMSAVPMASETDIVATKNHKKDSEIAMLVQRLFCSNDETLVLVDDDENLSFVVAACFVIRKYRKTPLEAILYVKTSLKTREDHSTRFWEPTKEHIAQISRYKRPLIALFCGDRNSAIVFEESITFELKSLPKFSTVIHGGCRGIDLYVEELARLQKIETICFKADWDSFGKAAGPMRNEKMLEETNPDVVFAYHPDIKFSKGTRDTMDKAWKRGIPVYIHDGKRKEKFNGDFNDL